MGDDYPVKKNVERRALGEYIVTLIDEVKEKCQDVVADELKVGQRVRTKYKGRVQDGTLITPRPKDSADKDDKWLGEFGYDGDQEWVKTDQIKKSALTVFLSKEILEQG